MRGNIIEKLSQEAEKILIERFGKDSVISLAATADNKPYVRYVNSYYEDRAFYVLTYALSNKMKQMEINPCAAIAEKMREVFSHGTRFDIDFSL